MQNYYFLLKNLAALTIISFIIAPVDFNDRIVDKEIPSILLDEIKVTEPISLDFDEIKKRGSIRIITSYNIGSFFLQGGHNRGFEYELFAGFARKHNLNTEIVLLKPGDNPIEALNKGDGDIIADNFIKTSSRSEEVYFSEPYKLINQHIVFSDKRSDITSIDDLKNITITVRRNSAQHETLLALKDTIDNFNIKLVPNTIDEEGMILKVANGDYQATITDNHHYEASKFYISGLKLGPLVTSGSQVGWGVRKNATDLQKEVDKYIYGNFKHDPIDNKQWQSVFLTILENRYYNNETQIENYRRDIHEMMYYGQLSPYDDLIRPAADGGEVDWKLAVAVMAQESAFQPNAVSFAGAVGLMQIVPKFSLIKDRAELMEPQINIMEGMRYLNKHFSHYSYLDPENQLALTLAAYNAGMGHVADARRLAIDSNKNPNDWDDVAEALLRLMDKRYYRNARYGYCRGTETVDYVHKVMARFNTYKSIAELINDSTRVENEEIFLVMGKMVNEDVN
ncbi:MAG: transporter substrate-binding domain-containing protein [Balneolales bacterium]